VRVGVSPHAPYTVSDDLFRATADLAREHHLPLAVHIAESELERRLVVDAAGSFADGLRRRGITVEPRGESSIQLLARLRLLDIKPLLIHCVRVDARDIASIAASQSTVAHCPTSNAKLGHGVAPLDEVLAAGITVGLGSDSMASNNRMDMLAEARMALLMQRARIASFESPAAIDVLELATIGGAKAIGIDHLVGTLEEGKQADLAAFAIDPLLPVQDPVTAAIFSITGAHARFVMVAGRPLVRDGALVTPRTGLAQRLTQLGDALAEWVASGGEMESSV